MTQEMIVSVASAAASLFVAFCSFLISFLKTKQATKEAEAVKARYAEAVFNQTYMICPHCGQKCELKDIIWLSPRDNRDSGGASSPKANKNDYQVLN